MKNLTFLSISILATVIGASVIFGGFVGVSAGPSQDLSTPENAVIAWWDNLQDENYSALLKFTDSRHIPLGTSVVDAKPRLDIYRMKFVDISSYSYAETRIDSMQTSRDANQATVWVRHVYKTPDGTLEERPMLHQHTLHKTADGVWLVEN